jgi:hypothetical protein
VLAPVLQDVTDANLLKAIFSADDIARDLREAAFASERGILVSGSKVMITRALGCVDPQLAYQAAKRSLVEPSNYERERYPALMVTLDSNRAITDLFQQMSIETASSVRAAIGRALATENIAERLQQGMNSGIPAERQAACRIAGYYQPDDAVQRAVRERLEDADARVFEAAIEAISQSRAIRRQSELLAAWKMEPERARRWRLLDVALDQDSFEISLGDLPENWQAVFAGSPHPMRTYLWDRIEKKRKQEAEEHERRDKETQR